MKRPSRPEAFTLVETVTTVALFLVLMLFLGEALRQSQAAFRNTNASMDATKELRTLANKISRDLRQTHRRQTNSTNTAASMVAPDGSALWFLSNVDQASQRPVFLPDGSPRWQRNILYYMRVPDNHVGLFGYNCGGGMGPGALGHDDRCPHKVLIRKVIDFNGPTNDTSEVVEALMTPAQALTYCTRPNGYLTAAMLGSEAGLEQVSIVGRNLLDFEVLPNPFPTAGPISLDLRAVTMARASRVASFGTTSLYETPLTYHFSMTILPPVP